MRLWQIPAFLTALLGSPALAELPALACVIDETCVAGSACQKAGDAFSLEPVPGGYGATIDSGWVEVRQVSPASAEVETFLLSTEDSISVLLSLYPDGAMALTVHEDIDGRYVETSFGNCVEDI